MIMLILQVAYLTLCDVMNLSTPFLQVNQHQIASYMSVLAQYESLLLPYRELFL